MDLIHISQRKNRESILKNGILPTEIKLPHHKEAFGDRGIYTWLDDPFKNLKFIRDLIYVKNWLHPRNDAMYSLPYDFNFKDYKDTSKPIDSDIYDVYLIDGSELLGYNGVHGQWSEDEFGTAYGLPDEYAHDDKDIFVTPQKIENFKIIDTVKYYIDKRNKYIFSYV